MRSRKNIKQRKNRGSHKVFSAMEKIYSREQYLEKRKELGKYKEYMSIECSTHAL